MRFSRTWRTSVLEKSLLQKFTPKNVFPTSRARLRKLRFHHLGTMSTGRARPTCREGYGSPLRPLQLATPFSSNSQACMHLHTQFAPYQ